MKQLFLLIGMLSGLYASAQTTLVPGSPQLELNRYKSRKQEMTYFTVRGNQQTAIGSFSIETSNAGNTVTLTTVLRLHGSAAQWIDTSIADSKTFQPLYRSSFSAEKEMVLRFGSSVTGYYRDKKTQRLVTVKESIKEGFFDAYMYPYLLGLLPLRSGYKTAIAVFEFNPASVTAFKKSMVEEVTSNLFQSPLTGDHQVWLVKVMEEATGDRYQYSIDKQSGRIWKIDIFSKGQHLLLVDQETDYNPLTAAFDKEQTLRLLQSGNATIGGQAFARDNENEGALKGMAVLNINKKQFAQPGTAVILIPYTAYFKEWMSLNEKLWKKGRSVPLAKEAAACIKTTTVYDQEGHFEFTNLMPGEYLLYTEFGYTHTTSRTEVIGYTDTYINGMFQGSSANTKTYKYGTNTVAGIKKIISIKKEGETVTVKLKKTL
ncbi:hypothetical protein IQ13_0954 [Lacibacter cauensis]|uniref:Carboxypeptidase family protein n=1 Tax=Lacibacter cauensis TaxID=510947 RepID=A0A562SWW6_9BACT|nr:hypothetical protein [Lacibacter cauensis]TWI85785.1 hypothetical protein IQ13_0954 [Lacibacter cauensis]